MRGWFLWTWTWLCSEKERLNSGLCMQAVNIHRRLVKNGGTDLGYRRAVAWMWWTKRLARYVTVCHHTRLNNQFYATLKKLVASARTCIKSDIVFPSTTCI